MLLAISCICALVAPCVGDVFKWKYTHDWGYTKLEILDDDLVHIEFGSGDGPSHDERIFTTPMVGKTDYSGPSELDANSDASRMVTNLLTITTTSSGHCITVSHKTKGELTTVCGDNMKEWTKVLSVSKAQMKNVYGLGQHFWGLGSSDGDWIGLTKTTDGTNGNSFAAYYGGANSQIQFPVYFALGDNNTAYGLLLDDVQKHHWSFQGDWWKASANGGDQLRLFIMGGDSLHSVRSNYMRLSGTPPVPPKKAFGLWISEFGFDNWDEVDCKLYGKSKRDESLDCENNADVNKRYLKNDGSLRKHGFPVDGIVLDLQWFGAVKGNSPDSSMGGLKWDTEGSYDNTIDPYFPNPKEKIQEYADDHIGIITIEESYVAENQWTFKEMSNRGALVRWGCGGPFWTDYNWMGKVGMVDWSNDAGATWWHDNLRQKNLVDYGVIGHWTDLGEPERWTDNGCYSGVEEGKHAHKDIHNIYNLLWGRSLYNGYMRHHQKGNQKARTRPLILARAGAPGIQRYGALMWSGDIAGRLDVLASHMRAAMHMSMSGIDYYGSDVGGFWRRAVNDDTAQKGQGPSEHWMFTQWFANSAWFDVPVRPHTYNCGFKELDVGNVDCPYEVSPAGVGDRHTNLLNIRQRYELTPYYYSLAHRAFLYGEAVFPPMALVFPDDKTLRTAGHQRMVGQDLMVGIVMSYGEENRNVFFPLGGWYNYHTKEWINSNGDLKRNEPVFRDGVFRLPTFARAGAIIPTMHVDAQTKDVFGHRTDGTVRDELIAQVYVDENNSGEEYEFTLYEDDGSTVNNYVNERPTYLVRTTKMTQVWDASENRVTVTIEAVQGDQVAELPESRNNELRVQTNKLTATQVKLDGVLLDEVTSEAFYATGTTSGWLNSGEGTVLVRTGSKSVHTAKQIQIDF